MLVVGSHIAIDGASMRGDIAGHASVGWGVVLAVVVVVVVLVVVGSRIGAVVALALPAIHT